MSKSRILGYRVERTTDGVRFRLGVRLGGMAEAAVWTVAVAATLGAGLVAAMGGPDAVPMLLVGGAALSVAVSVALSHPGRGRIRRPYEFFVGRAPTGEVIFEVDGDIRPASDVRSVVLWEVPWVRSKADLDELSDYQRQVTSAAHAVYVVLDDEVLDLGRTGRYEAAVELASRLAEALCGTVSSRSGGIPALSAAPLAAALLLAFASIAAMFGAHIVPHGLLGAVADGPDLGAATIVGALSLALISVALLIGALLEPLAVRGAERAAARRFGVAPSGSSVLPRPWWFALGASLLVVALAVLAASPLIAAERLRAGCAAGNATACDPFGERGVPRQAGSTARAVTAIEPGPLPAPTGGIPAIERPLEEGGASALAGVTETATPAARRGLQMSCAFRNGWFVLVPPLLVVDGETSSDPYGDYRAFFREMALSDDWLQSASVGADWFEPHAARRCPRQPTLVRIDSGQYTLLLARRGGAALNGHAESVTIDANEPTTLRFESAVLDETWTCSSCE